MMQSASMIADLCLRKLGVGLLSHIQPLPTQDDALGQPFTQVKEIWRELLKIMGLITSCSGGSGGTLASCKEMSTAPSPYSSTTSPHRFNEPGQQRASLKLPSIAYQYSCISLNEFRKNLEDLVPCLRCLEVGVTSPISLL